MASKFGFEVRRTNFHAGSSDGASPYGASAVVLSRHRTREAAERRARAHQTAGCTCGCAVVVDLARNEQ